MRRGQVISHDGKSFDRETLSTQVKHDHDYCFSVSSLSDIGAVIVENEEVIVLESVENPCNVTNGDSDASQQTLDTNTYNDSASTVNHSSNKTEDAKDKDKVIANLKKMVKAKSKKVSRLKSKVKSLQQKIMMMKRKQKMEKKCEEFLVEKFSGPSLEIFTRIMKSKSPRKYTTNMKSFALTLHFYSSKAYNFLRNSFSFALPHPKTITRWYSKIPADPGFTEPAFKALQLKVKLDYIKSIIKSDKRQQTYSYVWQLKGELYPKYAKGSYESIFVSFLKMYGFIVENHY